MSLNWYDEFWKLDCEFLLLLFLKFVTVVLNIFCWLVKFDNKEAKLKIYIVHIVKATIKKSETP